MNLHRPLALLVLCLCAGTAQAHSGHGDPTFWTGLQHPLAGLDHLLAMVAIGLWAACKPGPTAATVMLPPSLFIAGAALGTALGLAGFFNAGIEAVLAASLLPLGLAMLVGERRVPRIALLAVPLFGLLHGAAHGHEVAALAKGAAIAGFLIGTALLHALGLGMAIALSPARRRLARAGTGSGLFAAGLWLLA